IGSDIEIRQTLEENLLDCVAVSLDLPRDLRMQRPVVVRQTTQKLQNGFADLLFSPLGFGNSVDLIYRSLALLQLALRNLVHPAKKRILDRLFLGKKEARNQECSAQQKNYPQFHQMLPHDLEPLRRATRAEYRCAMLRVKSAGDGAW